MTNRYIIEAKGSVVRADFRAHRRPPVSSDKTNPVVWAEFINNEQRRQRIIDGQMVLSLFGDEWKGVVGALNVQCVCNVNIMHVEGGIQAVKQSIERVFAAVNVPPGKLTITPISRYVIEVGMPMENYQTAIAAMNACYNRTLEQQRNGAPFRS